MNKEVREKEREPFSENKDMILKMQRRVREHKSISTGGRRGGGPLCFGQPPGEASLTPSALYINLDHNKIRRQVRKCLRDFGDA